MEFPAAVYANDAGSRRLDYSRFGLDWDRRVKMCNRKRWAAQHRHRSGHWRDRWDRRRAERLHRSDIASEVNWDCSDALHELWFVMLESRAAGAVDYDACLLALKEPADVQPSE